MKSIEYAMGPDTVSQTGSGIRMQKTPESEKVDPLIGTLCDYVCEQTFGESDIEKRAKRSDRLSTIALSYVRMLYRIRTDKFPVA